MPRAHRQVDPAVADHADHAGYVTAELRSALPAGSTGVLAHTNIRAFKCPIDLTKNNAADASSNFPGVRRLKTFGTLPIFEAKRLAYPLEGIAPINLRINLGMLTKGLVDQGREREAPEL